MRARGSQLRALAHQAFSRSGIAGSKWYSRRMPGTVKDAVDTYIAAASERDPAARAKLLETCFAEDGCIVTRNREIRGRAALADEFAALHADPQFLPIRIVSAIDAQGATFRFLSAVERHDGQSREFFDAGEIDATGRISRILTFAERLADS